MLRQPEDIRIFVATEQVDGRKAINGLCSLVSEQFDTLSHEQVDYYSTPATSVQFKQYAQAFTLEAQMPGLRILDLYENGEIITSIK